MTVFSDFDPEWTAQQALDAGSDGPKSPLHRWAAWHLLDEYRVVYEAGRNTTLFTALRLCACHGLPMPDWLADAYIRGHNLWISFDAPSLDEAFDVQVPKGTHIGRLKRNRKLVAAIYVNVRELRRQGRAVDESLFRDVGLALNVSGSTVRDAYYKSPLLRLLQKKR